MKKYIFRVIIFIVISLVVGLTIYTINARKVTGNRLVMPFNKTIAYVTTGSMLPTIKGSDLIVIEKTNDYEVDDIVVYQDGNLIVVHRIISIEGEKVITAGDGNDGSLDDPINMNMIQGEVIKIIPVLGFILKLLKSPVGIILIISSAIFLLVLSYKKEQEMRDEQVDSLKEEIKKLRKELGK